MVHNALSGTRTTLDMGPQPDRCRTRVCPEYL